jgi:hypothetical protein
MADTKAVAMTEKLSIDLSDEKAFFSGMVGLLSIRW